MPHIEKQLRKDLLSEINNEEKSFFQVSEELAATVEETARSYQGKRKMGKNICYYCTFSDVRCHDFYVPIQNWRWSWI